MTADFGLPANGHPETLASVGEGEVLRRIFPRLPHADAELLGPGDDAAMLAAPDGRYVVTTDMMIHGPDFRTAWSTPHDLGWKAAMTNLADVAAMGARPTALVVAIAAPLDTPVSVLLGIADGLREACELAAPGCGVVGGDLSVSSTLTLAVTAFGDLEGRPPVTRAGARPGDVVAVAGDLGRAGAGIWLLFRDGVAPGAVEPPHPPAPAPSTAAPVASAPVAPVSAAAASAASSSIASAPAASAPAAAPAAAVSTATAPVAAAPAAVPGVRAADRAGAELRDVLRSVAAVGERGASGAMSPGEPDEERGRALREAHPDLIEAQLAPRPPIAAGVAAGVGGATAMLDVSDGLVLDARRIAQASGCAIRFDAAAIESEARELTAIDAIVGAQAAHFVLAGGEDHALLATFPASAPLPAGFRPLGEVVAGEAAVLIGDHAADERGGWDPYADWNGRAG